MHHAYQQASTADIVTNPKRDGVRQRRWEIKHFFMTKCVCYLLNCQKKEIKVAHIWFHTGWQIRMRKTSRGFIRLLQVCTLALVILALRQNTHCGSYFSCSSQTNSFDSAEGLLTALCYRYKWASAARCTFREQHSGERSSITVAEKAHPLWLKKKIRFFLGELVKSQKLEI